MKVLGNLLKREIVSLFFLTILKFRTITTKISEGKKHSRIILVCWLAGLSCKLTPFRTWEKKFYFRAMTLEVRKNVLS